MFSQRCHAFCPRVAPLHAGGRKEQTPEAANIPEQPKEAAKDALSALNAAAQEQPEQAAQEAASTAKEALPEAPKELPNPFQGFFSGKVVLPAHPSSL
jgi:hypothetical protein